MSGELEECLSWEQIKNEQATTTLRFRAEKLVRIIDQFAASYPEEIFPPLTKQESEQHAMVIPRIAAHVCRLVGKGLVEDTKELREALGK